MQRRCDSFANTQELHLFCIIPSIFIDWFSHFDPYAHCIWLDRMYQIWGPKAHLFFFFVPFAVHDEIVPCVISVSKTRYVIGSNM